MDPTLAPLVLNVESMPESMSTVSYGVINWFDDERGFGFVTPAEADRDVFVDFSEIIDSSAGKLHAGQRVSYQAGGTRHWPLAQAVHVAEVRGRITPFAARYVLRDSWCVNSASEHLPLFLNALPSPE
jgi:CspA family cold shock protein